jgi:hypothetical protein
VTSDTPNRAGLLIKHPYKIMLGRIVRLTEKNRSNGVKIDKLFITLKNFNKFSQAGKLEKYLRLYTHFFGTSQVFFGHKAKLAKFFLTARSGVPAVWPNF